MKNQHAPEPGGPEPSPDPVPAKQRSKQKGLRIPCPVWGTALFYVVADGIEIKCHSCRSTGAVHHISKASLEALWLQLATPMDAAFLPPAEQGA